MIMSQAKMFNFFPGSVDANSIIRILPSFVGRYKHNYIPHCNLWINGLYFGIANSRQKQCLTIDTRDINDLGPVKFRTQADSNIEKKFAIITETKKTGFNSFLAVKKKQRLFLK